jgi:3-oxoacyl-[acyl-carrier protein] reductase
VQRIVEPSGVDLDGRGVEAVPAVGGADVEPGEGAPEPEQVGLHRGRRIAGRFGGPQRVDDGVDADDGAAPQHQEREQALLQRAVGRDVAACGVSYLDGSEDPYPQSALILHPPRRLRRTRRSSPRRSRSRPQAWCMLVGDDGAQRGAARMGWFEDRAGFGGTVAIVTGGAGGLGASITTDLADNGVAVAVIDIDDAAVERLRSTLARAGRDGIVVAGDARDPDTLAALFDAVDERWGRLDTLVNVVGGTFRAPFTETTPKGWDALLRTNLLSVLHSCSLAAPRMLASGRGGSIVNLTTIEAHRAAPGFAVYAAAKAGVEQFSRTLAVELAPHRIRVNTVAPDFTPTENMQRLAGGGPLMTDEAVRIGIPLGRAGHPTDVSGCVVFLASALGSYVTGTTLHPDGGTHASSGWFNWPGTGWGNNVPATLVEHLPEPG